MTYRKQLENVEYFKHLGRLITNDATYTRDINFTIAMANATFNRKKNLHQQIRLKFKEETCEVLNLEHTEKWTLR
jgi:hypothetical protein